jgi:hypothetical protein
MRLPEKRFKWQVGGWKLGLTLCPGIWLVGVWWDDNPISFAIRLPFVLIWFERAGGKYWPWDWTILRVVVGKQEFRADLALNDWGLGIVMHQTDDWSIHLGPIDIECEYAKFYDDDLYMKPAAHLRLFSKARELCECELEDTHRLITRFPSDDGSKF